MDWKMNPNAVNQFTKNSVIYTEGEAVFSVAMIIKGRVMIHNDGARLIVGSGSFLGINDLYLGRYQSTYTAYDDLMIYVFPISRVEELESVLSINKDYHGFMVASYYKIISDLNQIYMELLKQGGELYQFLNETYKEYQDSAVRRGYKAKQSERISKLRVLENDLELIGDSINYYCECRNLPIETVKAFYSYGNAITLYQIEDQVNIVNQQLDALKTVASEYIKMTECLISNNEDCLFRIIAELSVEMDNRAGDQLLEIMDTIVEQINKAENFAERMLGRKLVVDRKKMEEVYHVLLTGSQESAVSSETIIKYSKDDTKRALTELKDSFDKILNYAGIKDTKADEMRTAMLDYVQMKDKFGTEDTSRLIRRKLTENHYVIYKQVFIRAYKEKNQPRLIDLFLKYGFADERLLTTEQLLSLYFLPEQDTKQYNCKVFDIKAWLTMIYEGKREPSKNEFDLEYPEYLASMKKQASLTEKEVVFWLHDPEKRLEYEIHNMFRYNNRTTSGQITSFVPVLHKDLYAGFLDKLLVTPNKVNEAVDRLMKIDYSVFDREMMYANKEKNIVKEYIIKRVYPDIILMPNIGSNGVMWQEITGKRRDSAGRFLLPIFTEVSLESLLIRIFGRFRWELCRTMEGASWNDIKHKSLTSEYCDYLQFYRKNKELSEEKKEKIKLQIQKGRNSSREIFVIDYEQWINYESMGAIKLNKLVREIMAYYCPFSKELREQVKMQPLFEEAMARYFRDKLKKIREVEGRHRMLQKDQIEITQELIDTLVYYRDL